MTRRVDFEPTMASLGRAVVAIGVFDGVHLGHQALVAEAVRRARDTGVISVVTTFDRDPDQVVTPESAAPQLLSLTDKIDFLSELGADTILVVPFCMRMAATPANRFVDEVIQQAVSPTCIVVGKDFRFGRYAEGDSDRLRALGNRHGFDVVPLELVEAHGGPITSTRIRALVAGGDTRAATRLLGRYHRVRGMVHRGRGAGRSLGFPTANVLPSKEAALPADGVYAGRAITQSGTFSAALSVGRPPSFPEAGDVLEAHLLDFCADLLGQDVVLEFVERIRDQRAFESHQELNSAIAADVERVRDIMSAESTNDERTR